MRRILAVFSLVAFSLAAFTLAAAAQSQAGLQPSRNSPRRRRVCPTAVVKDLPVRKVVLYKNGVGYFEHAGR